MTFEEKLKADGHRMPSIGCPSDYGYEEQESYSTHCSHILCDECWKRKMKEEENDMKYHVGDTVLIQGVVTEVDERKGDDFHTKVKFHVLSDMMFWFKDELRRRVA